MLESVFYQDMTKVGWTIFALILLGVLAITFALISQTFLLQSKAQQGIGTNTKANIYIPQ